MCSIHNSATLLHSMTLFIIKIHHLKTTILFYSFRQMKLLRLQNTSSYKVTHIF